MNKPVDILYTLFNETESKLEDLAISVNSLAKNDYPFRLCFADTGTKGSALNNLKKVIRHKFEYAYEPINGPAASTYNFGFKKLIKSNMFIMVEKDIIVGPTFIEDMLRMANGTYHVSAMFRIPRESSKIEYNTLKCLTYQFLNKLEMYSCIAMNSKMFKELNGWDEDYIGWGISDTDLFFRAALYTNKQFSLIENNKEKVIVFHINHPVDVNKITIDGKRNWDRLKKRVTFYENKILPLDAINGLEKKSIVDVS